MFKKATDNIAKATQVFEPDPIECPFREFRDNELQIDYWGMGTAAFRASTAFVKIPVKPAHDPHHTWIDDQTQPLPRSARHYLHRWIRAEELAMDRWEAEVVIFEENNGGRMSVADMQLSHAQVLMRSSFCRRALSACFMLERVEGIIVEHQWDNFVCNFGPEGWRAKYHIYCPGMKPGGGVGHKPGLSKNGCYLVRLFFMGAWRCVWVSDLVPVDATDSPLLPFSPMMTRPPASKPGGRQPTHTVTAGVVFLWPLLICKALLKLAAPDMNSDEYIDCIEDEPMEEFDVINTLTGAMNLRYKIPDKNILWSIIITEVPVFSWDDDDETQPSTVKSRSTKKPTAKEGSSPRRGGMMYLTLRDTKELPPYHLPGITPGHEMNLLITMARDIPLKKPLPEPEVALWKYYRWVDWARRHGLYEAYDCPRTKYLKINGLMKLSYAPHLLDVQSTESITLGFIEEHVKSPPQTGEPDPYARKKDKKTKEQIKAALNAMKALVQANKEELREWVQYAELQPLVKYVQILYYPSMFQLSSSGSSAPLRVARAGQRSGESYVHAPKSGPLYLQIDGPESSKLRMSLRTLHPRVLANAGVPIHDFIEQAHMVIEKFEWFKDAEIALPKGFMRTRGYTTVEVIFPPGRHFCRIWNHSRMHWHNMLISDSTLLLGTRDVILGAAVRDCPWASRFLYALGSAFTNWTKVDRSSPHIMTSDREFFRSYLPDLEWDNEVVGYDRSLLHWMFRKALQSHLMKRLTASELRATCNVLRKYFCDPDFGFPPKPRPPRSVREIANLDVCDCVMPVVEEVECLEEEQLGEQPTEEKPIVDAVMMSKLLLPPKPPIASQVCELATEELPCGILKEEREKVIRKHEAATVLQAYWRGTWARKCLRSHVTFTAEVNKCVQEGAFGHLEALSSLMNEFFGMFPGTKYAYSVGSALSGLYGLHQHTGSTPVTTKCKWIPYFQGVFYCHYPVKVHFDVQSSIAHSTLAVYDNDTEKQLPQAFNSHKTFDFKPNFYGYTVAGYGILTQVPSTNYDAHWQLTVMSSIDGTFHICDNEEPCREVPLAPASKLHLDEIFLPNRRNILGGIQIAVTKHESVSFRVAATSRDLEMVATLRSISPSGETEVLSECSGKGEIFWPYIRLESVTPAQKAISMVQGYGSARDLALISTRSMNKHMKRAALSKTARSVMKLKTVVTEQKLYSIQVVCPWGWPLNLAQWKRVDEVRNTQEVTKVEPPQKKVLPKEKAQTSKPASAKEKEKPPTPFQTHVPQPGDAYVELECSVATGGGAISKREDDRDLEFANARKDWDAKEPGRNQRGAQIRKEFRTEFLEVPPPQPSESSFTSPENDTTFFEETEPEEDLNKDVTITLPGPTPATESGLLEMSVESEEEALYLLMPEQLRDKFVPLYFLPFCMKDKNEEESVLVTSNMAEAAKNNRQARIEAAMERMRELQAFNEEHVLGRQGLRCSLLEKLFVDAQWPPQLQEVLDERDEAITKEALNRTLSATKKKLEAKKK